MAPNGIWYVGFPTYRYNEDVKALANESGLRILDARFDVGDGADDAPSLTLKAEYEPKAAKEPEEVQTYSVFKIVDGERSGRASKGNLTREEAEAYATDRPDNKYDIVESDD